MDKDKKRRILGTRVIRKDSTTEDIQNSTQNSDGQRKQRSAPFSAESIQQPTMADKKPMHNAPKPAQEHPKHSPVLHAIKSAKDNHHKDRQNNHRNDHRDHHNNHQDNKSSHDKREVSKPIPPAGENIRIIPLGGVEEVGRNMMAIEYKDEIIVIDGGFGFTDEDTPGVDYILPNTRYLEERKDKIKAILITHGHLDHIGGLPYIMPRIGNPPLYTRNLTALMIKKDKPNFRLLQK